VRTLSAVKRVALLASLLVLAVLTAACGAAETTQTDESPPDEQAIAASQVIDTFAKAQGSAVLERTAGTDAAWDQLSPGLNPSPAIQKQYGTFSVYVVKPDRAEAVRSLLRDKETQQELEQGDGGVYWEFDDLSKTYVAYKRYGPNVVLAWWNEKPQPGTDARFERLDALMSRLQTG
jgi:hypothetical protein